MDISRTIGFFADTFTFSGAVILAVDAFIRERDFSRQKDLISMVKSFARVRFVVEGIELIDENSTALVFIRQSARRALWGTIILAVGFIGQIVARVLAIC